jgi:hypothetical protein
VRRRWLFGVMFACIVVTGILAAQAISRSMNAGRKPKGPTGAIAGTVYCADTNLPARLATVFLDADAMDDPDGTHSASTQATTDLDGRFVFPHVAEGVYFISVQLPGYVDLRSELLENRMNSKNEEARKEIVSRMTTVKVVANQTADLSLRAERGPEIDGTVLYDDGSPAIGLKMTLQPKYDATTLTGDMPFPFPGVTREVLRATDDHGRYRILGIPPGDYRVAVSVPALSTAQSEDTILQLVASTFDALVVYYGDTLRGSKAKVIHIEPGEKSHSADITIPINTLHTVKGQVVLKSTGTPPPTTVLELLYADTRELARSTIARDGEFEFRYIPEGNFILAAIASATSLPKFDPDSDENEGGGFAFQMPVNLSMAGREKEGAEIPLLVKGDLDAVSIAVPDPPIDKERPAGDQETQTSDQPSPQD